MEVKGSWDTSQCEENLQVEPDIRVPLNYEDFLNGTDAQLEAAVKEMLKEIAGK